MQGADPAVVAGWIAETQAERQRAEKCQQAAAVQVPDELGSLTEEQIITIVEELGDMITALGDAEPEHKLEVYRPSCTHSTRPMFLVSPRPDRSPCPLTVPPGTPPGLSYQDGES